MPADDWFRCVAFRQQSWRHHQMETFSALLALFVRGIRWSPVKSLHRGQWRGACFLWSVPEKRLSKQSRRRWFETPLRPLLRRCNAVGVDGIGLAFHYNSLTVDLDTPCCRTSVESYHMQIHIHVCFEICSARKTYRWNLLTKGQQCGAMGVSLVFLSVN